MTKRMLIDSTHAEETRVVVLDGNRLEDFDVETSTKKQLKGNIYLAKIVRVEPSLQAAFVEYGNGRHGFLAFGEIHPDYYQIPVADRKRLLEMQAAEARDEDEDEDEPRPARRQRPEREPVAARSPVEEPEDEPAVDEPVPESPEGEPPGYAPVEQEPPELEPPVGEPAPEEEDRNEPEPPAYEASAHAAADDVPSDVTPDAAPDAAEPDAPEPDAPEPDAPEPDAPEPDAPAPRAQPALIAQEVKFGAVGFGEFGPDAEVASIAEEALEAGEAEAAPMSEEEADAAALPAPETIGGESDVFEGNGAEEARARRSSRMLRSYRIQEVIRRRQIMLIQVVKEERGTKGAALTTYISLAGRFCVLMPNSPRGGGISRKITSAADRRRLKEITAELEIPQGMGLIVRTAGAARPKPEIKRDCEYLLRLWDDIRDHTLRSTAPALIYEEASLIKRSIRDGYSRDIDEVLVDGEDGWRAAHDFMRMLMPAHAKKVIQWKRGGTPLFSQQGVEAQLDAMLSPTVQLKSGGYLVINQAEALVAIDVNSGRATRERGIEETALKTNMEAADEVARQLRLRDLAGLIVIDFIDMEAKKHNLMVERRLKDALKNDRARIQVGFISHFGLLEMSRQRLRPSLTETSFTTCAHCAGTGLVRSVESSAIHVLRAIEDEGAKDKAALIMVHVANAVAMYLLNHKRARLAEIETRYAMQVHFAADETLVPPEIRIDRVKPQIPVEERVVAAPVAPAAPVYEASEDDDEDVATEEDEADMADAPPVRTEAGPAGETAEEGQRRRRRRRRGGRRDGGEDAAAVPAAPAPSLDAEAFAEPMQAEAGGFEAGGFEAGGFEAGGLDAGESGATAAGDPATAEQPNLDPAELDENGLPKARRRGRRGGRRRRRDGAPAGGDATAEEATAEDATMQDGEPAMAAAPVADAAPAYAGPTPANPFGSDTYDIFDMIERAAEQSASPAPEPPLDIPAVPAGATQPEPVAAAVPEAAAMPEPEAHPESVAEAAAEPEPVPEPSAEEPPRAAATPVSPPPAEAKRGWWRR